MKPRLSTRVEPRVDKHRDLTGHRPIPIPCLLITYTTAAAPAAITSKKTTAMTAITFGPPSSSSGCAGAVGVGEAVASGCAAVTLTGV